ncbi:MAG: hypothetical protein ACLQOO_05570 [Terriglobia bacterium]
MPGSQATVSVLLTVGSLSQTVLTAALSRFAARRLRATLCATRPESIAPLRHMARYIRHHHPS